MKREREREREKKLLTISFKKKCSRSEKDGHLVWRMISHRYDKIESSYSCHKYVFRRIWASCTHTSNFPEFMADLPLSSPVDLM